MSFGIHFSGEVAIFLIQYIAVFGQECHCLYRECQNGACTLLIKPFHKTLLQPAKRIPVGFASVGENKVLEKAIEIILVIISHIPENCLEIAGTRRLVDGIYDLLETVCDDFIDRSLFQRQVCQFIQMFIIVLSVFQTNEIVHVHQEFRSGTCAA